MPEPIVFSCPNCRSILSAPAHPAGASGPCPVCGITIAAPDNSSDGSDKSKLSELSDPSDRPPEPPEPPEPRETTSAPDAPPQPSPGLARRVALFILLGTIATAVWLSRDALFPSPPASPEKLTITPNQPPSPGIPGGNPPSEPTPVDAPETPEIATQRHPVNSPVPDPGAPIPESYPEPSPQVPSIPPPPQVDPPVVAIPSPAPVAAVAPPSPPAFHSDFKSAAQAFIRADTPEARLPLLFSTRWSPEQLAEQLASGSLSRLPTMEYKAVVHVSKPPGTEHFYVAVKTSETGAATTRELLLHLTPHGNAGFRVNADALAFHLENPFPAYLAKPNDAPLPAWVFIERGRFQGEADPGNRLCLNLRMGPFTPVIAQALVEPDSPLVAAINPWVAWGALPKPVFLDLRQTQLDQATILTPGHQITAEWLPPPAP